MKKRVLHLGVASFLALLPALVDAQATNPPYLSQMPSVEQVMGGIKGADAMDTAARRMGAFWQLQKIVEALGNPRRSRAQLTPDEGRLIGQYRYGYSLAGQPFAHIDKDPSHPDRPKWFEKHSFYETDDAFLDVLLRQFFSPEFQAGYYRSVNREPPQSKSVQSVAANNRPQPSAPGATAGTYLAQAEKHRQAGDFVRAIEAYRQALAIERSAPGYLGLGVAYSGQGEHQLAVSALKQGLDEEVVEQGGRGRLDHAWPIAGKPAPVR